jgi:hypothetical protein
LSLVLGNISVNVLDDIETDWSAQDCWETDLGNNLAISTGVDRSTWSSGLKQLD